MLLSQVPGYFSERRDRLQQLSPGSAFVLPCAPEAIRNSDVYHSYRQESHFYYLSAFDEPNACLLILPALAASKKKHRLVMFVQERNETKEIWTGERYGVERAVSVFGADEAYPFSKLEEKLPELLREVDKVYYPFGIHKEIDHVMHKSLEAQKKLLGIEARGLLPVFDCGPVIGEMRLIKDQNDLAMLRKACEISAKSHAELMRQVKPSMSEREIQALVDYHFVRQGCERLGYPSIVAGGANATCLHYTRNNEYLKDGDLLLVDAGGEYGYYTADITRTFPVGKKFTPEQSDIYDIVLASQKEAIEHAKPGVTLFQIHERTVEVLTDGLISLGLLKGNKNQILEEKKYTRFYPHRTSHWLGMDVHDAGLYQVNRSHRALEPGMVFTIEPGIYCQPNDMEIPEKFRGIGIRIEDDILITQTGNENLTSSLAREKKDIEDLRSTI